MRQFSIVTILAVLSILLSPWATAMKSNSSTVSQSIAAKDALSSNHSRTQRVSSFTMVLPQRTGAKFSMLSLSLQTPQSGALPVPFDIKTARLFKEVNQERQAIAIHQTWIDETGTLWIEFKPSLPPQTKLVLSLAAHPPAAKTVYEYGIAAYVDSDYPSAVLVDTGMITIQ